MSEQTADAGLDRRIEVLRALLALYENAEPGLFTWCAMADEAEARVRAEIGGANAVQALAEAARNSIDPLWTGNVYESDSGRMATITLPVDLVLALRAALESFPE